MSRTKEHRRPEKKYFDLQEICGELIFFTQKVDFNMSPGTKQTLTPLLCCRHHRSSTNLSPPNTLQASRFSWRSKTWAERRRCHEPVSLCEHACPIWRMQTRHQADCKFSVEEKCPPFS